MPEVSIEIDDIASVGVVRDAPPHEIPPEAWTLAENMRVVDDSLAMLSGEQQIFGTPGVAPYFAQFVSAPGQPWWLYAGLQKIYAWDGTTHTNITRQSVGVDVNYNATGAADWQGTTLGGIPILNNGIDVPQYWSAYSAATKMANLPNWTANMTAEVIRAFGPYLLALNITLSGVLKPNEVRWSSPADPGTIPTSWDITDPTKNAGNVTLPDVESGQILDGLPLQGRFYVYKENSVWRFRNIGGRFIFDEDAFLETIGLLAKRCVAVTGDGQRHIFMSNDNLFMHDGNSAKPLLNKRMQRYLVNQMDVSNYVNSFMFVKPLANEAWFCYPSNGNQFPNRAIIYNYLTGISTESDVDFQAAATGTVQTTDTDQWDSSVGTWDTDNNPWSVALRRQLVLSKPTATKFLQLDEGIQRDGANFTGTLQRLTLGVIGRKRTGEWIEDFSVRKLVTRVWPKIQGGPVNIRLGSQVTVDGPVTWSNSVSYDPAVSDYCDIIAEGAAISIEFSSSSPWQLDGYKLDMQTLGKY